MMHCPFSPQPGTTAAGARLGQLWIAAHRPSYRTQLAGRSPWRAVRVHLVALDGVLPAGRTPRAAARSGRAGATGDARSSQARA